MECESFHDATPTVRLRNRCCAGCGVSDRDSRWGGDNSSHVVAYANLADFSVNGEADLGDRHTASISLADWSIR